MRVHRILFLVAGAGGGILSGCCPHHGSGGSGTIVGVDGVGKTSDLDFGSVLVGQTKTLQLKLTDTGAQALAVLNVALSGPDAQDFKVRGNLPPSIQQDATASVSVVFAPSAGGARTANVTIQTNSQETPMVTAKLTGAGIELGLCAHPSTLDFGNVQVLGTPSVQEVDLGNCGPSPFSITAGPVKGTQAGDFSLSAETSATLPPGGKLVVWVSYSPAAIGPSSAFLPLTVSLTGCTNCTAPSISLAGVGVDGALVFSPSPVSFPSVPAGTTSTQKVLVSNVGTEPVTIGTNDLGTLGGNSVFTLSGVPQLPVTISPGGNVPLFVVYSPSSQAGDQDTLVAWWFVKDPKVSPREATDLLSGNQVLGPCSLQVAPAALNFGNVKTATQATEQVTLTNSGGTACKVSGITLDPASDPDFGLASGQAVALAVPPGSSAKVGVTFSSPQNANAPLLRRGTLVFTTGDPQNPNAAVPLSAFIDKGSVYSGGWPKWHHDNGNTGQTGADTSTLKGTVGWTFNVGSPTAGNGWLGGTFLESPVIDGSGNIYFLEMDGTYVAVSPAGQKLWSVALSDPSQDPHPCTPAILAGGSMYVNSGSEQNTDPNLYLISSSGNILYQTTFGVEGFSSTPGLGNDGVLFEADDDGIPGNGPDKFDIIAFQAQASGQVSQIGQYRLPFSVPGERLSVAIADDDTSYWCSGAQCFAVSPPKSGFAPLPAWPARGVTLANTDPNAQDNGDGVIISDLAVDLYGTTGFIYAYAGWEDLDPSSNDYSVQGVLVALDPSNGAQKWTMPLRAGPLPSGWNVLMSDYGNAPPAIGNDGTVYVGNGDGLHAVDGATGQQKWIFKSANVSDAPAVGGDGTVFFGCSDGNFYAVGADGRLRFQIQTKGAISSSPAIATDGTVDFVSDDGNLYHVN